jgi:NADP-dependent 3-hydroxy acid dehydrogenase YdfG
VPPVKTELALVTGASRGLGEGVARALAGRCKVVILMARDKPSLVHIASEINTAGGQAVPMACDVSDFGEVERAVSEARHSFGDLDIVINNAGVIEPISQIATSAPAISTTWCEPPCRACSIKGAVASSTFHRAPLTKLSTAGAPIARARRAWQC